MVMTRERAERILEDALRIEAERARIDAMVIDYLAGKRQSFSFAEMSKRQALKRGISV